MSRGEPVVNVKPERSAAALVPAFDWAEKHRPRTLDALVGNSAAVQEIRAWAERWKDGTPEDERALILAGEPGVGKTTAAHALAHDMGWGVIEMNASDARTEDVVRRVAGSGAVNRAFAFSESGELATGSAGRQLIILDEADNLFGREDRGGMKAIVETIRVTKQPIVLIANDLYEMTRRAGALKTLARTVKFTRVHTKSIPKALARIAEIEKVTMAPGVAEAIAERAGGDMRSAVNDLAALAMGRERIEAGDVAALGSRERTGDVWELLGKVFYGTSLDEARKASFNLDETPEDIALWIDENLPIMYTEKADLVDGFAMLSRADVYLGRVRRRQQYGLWSYATTLMTGGVAVAKSRRPSGARFAFPSWLRKLSTAKAVREMRKEIALKIGEETHTSTSTTIQEMFPLFRAMMAVDEEFAAWATWNFRLEPEELAFLLNAKATDARVKDISERAKARAPRMRAVAGGLGSFDEGEEGEGEREGEGEGDGGEKQKPKPTPKPKPKPTAKGKAKPKEAGAEPASTPPSTAAEPKAAEKGDAKDPTRNKKLFDF